MLVCLSFFILMYQEMFIRLLCCDESKRKQNKRELESKMSYKELSEDNGKETNTYWKAAGTILENNRWFENNSKVNCQELI